MEGAAEGHAQAESEAGCERIAGHLVPARSDLLHHVHHVTDGADAPAQLLNAGDEPDDIDAFRLEPAQVQKRYVGAR